VVNTSSEKTLELKRQLVHLFSGLLIVLLYHLGHLDALDVFFMLIIGIMMFFLLKVKNFKFLDFLIHHLERPGSTHVGIGVVNYLIGVFFAILIFDTILNRKDIAAASILILAVGDSVGPVIGMHFGKTKIRIISEVKLIEGILAAIVLSSLAASFFVPLGQAIIAATIAMLVEAVELKNKIDDNILIPLVSGVVLYFISNLGWIIGLLLPA
jgi:dolichol kinase